MSPSSFERQVPSDFEPSIASGQKLVGFRVKITERNCVDGRLWHLRLRYAALPHGIYERAIADQANPERLSDRPDVVWTTRLPRPRWTEPAPSPPRKVGNFVIESFPPRPVRIFDVRVFSCCLRK